MSNSTSSAGGVLTSMMNAALNKIGTEWGPYPNGVYERTLKALKKRGLIEERFVQEGKSARWQYRKAPTMAQGGAS